MHPGALQGVLSVWCTMPGCALLSAVAPNQEHKPDLPAPAHLQLFESHAMCLQPLLRSQCPGRGHGS